MPVTTTTKIPGSSTCAASSVACTGDSRTPASRTRPDCAAYRRRKVVLAADPAQHAQPGDGVGAERGEPPGLVPLVELALLQGAHDEGQRGEQQRTADEHDDAEQHRAAAAG